LESPTCFDACLRWWRKWWFDVGNLISAKYISITWQQHLFVLLFESEACLCQQTFYIFNLEQFFNLNFHIRTNHSTHLNWILHERETFFQKHSNNLGCIILQLHIQLITLLINKILVRKPCVWAGLNGIVKLLDSASRI
jgi:hypothetical protein